MEKSILNKTASYFNTHADTVPKPVNVLQFLTDQSCIKLQDEIKSCVDPDDKKALKAEAKCIAGSGTFSKRGESGLIQHSGLIFIDADFKDNKEVFAHPKFFESVCALPYVAYFGRSISGSGYFGIIPISNPAKHKEHFAAIVSVFKSMGIVLDEAPKNVASLRYQSYDPDAYFNHNATLFSFIKESNTEPKNKQKQDAYKNHAQNSTNTNPFHDYNANGDIEDLLRSKGWTVAGNGKEGQVRYTRPGKKKGVSADWHPGRRTLFVFSSDPETGMDTPMKGYSPSSVFYQMEGCVSTKQCAKKLYDLNYGQPKN